MIRKLTTQSLTVALAILVLPAMPASGEHVVPPSELYQEALSASQARQQRLEKVERFFSSEAAVSALKSMKLDHGKVVKAVPLLNDEELARIAARADKVDNDFAAGALTNQQLTYIVIALATAVIVLILV